MDNFQNFIIIFLILIVSIVLYQAIFIRTKTKFHLPPSPLYLPLIGHFHLFLPIPHVSLQKLSNRYGPLFQIYLGSIPCIVISSAEIVEELFQNHDVSFSNRPPNTAIRYLTYDAADFAYAPYGTYWRFMKKLCMTELLNGKMLDQLLPIRQEEINKFLLMLHKRGEVGEVVDVGAELLKLLNSIIMRMAIGKSCFDFGDDADQARKQIKEAMELATKLNFSDYFWFCQKLDLQGFGKRLKEVRDGSDARIEKIIREHEEARKELTRKDATKDILDAILSISEYKNSEVKINRVNIKAFLKDLFEGGTGTTAVTIEWALKELINNPTVMEKASNEIDSVVGKNRIATESDIINLPYLQAVVKESLRLHPPGPLMSRVSNSNCTLAGYDIPANTHVYINLWAIGRDPKYWDNPLEFKPERFLNESGKTSQLDVRGQHYQLMPFGSGRRACPAMSLALNIVQTSLAAMIQCFEWKTEDGGNDRSAGTFTCTPTPRLVPFPSLSC